MIVKLDESTLADVESANEPFDVIGRVLPVYRDGRFAFDELLDPAPRLKQYPNDEVDYRDYIGSDDRIVFLYYIEGRCVGQIRLRGNWNRLAFVEDIAVSRAERGRGIGSALVRAAIDWAKERRLRGLMLETQDTNVLACRFYAKLGFELGGVDTLLYSRCPGAAGERALFWYLLL